MHSYLSLVRKRRHYRHLWLAEVISLGGDWFNTVATVILVNRYSGSGLAVGSLFLARALPPFVLGPAAGVAADRFNRKAVLIMADVLRALIVLGFLLVNSADRVWLVYALSVLQFSVSAFFEPARAAILPSLVRPDELLVANTLSSITWSAMLTLGAAIGGFTAAAFGPSTALVIDSLSFVGSALLVLRIAAPTAAARRAAESGWTQFVDGVRYVAGRSDLAPLTLVKAMGQVGNADVLIALFARNVFVVGHEGAITIGVMFAVHGVGAMLGPLIGNSLGDGTARYLKRAIVIGYAVLPLAWLMLGVAPSLAIAAAAAGLRGGGASLNWTYSSVLLQMKAPDQFLGRVFALDFGVFTLAMALAVWLTGLTVDLFGLSARQMCLLLAVGSLLPFFIWALSVRRGEQRQLLSATTE